VSVGVTDVDESEVERRLTSLPPQVQARLLAVVHPMMGLDREELTSLWTALGRMREVAELTNVELEAVGEPPIEASFRFWQRLLPLL
jgi:hypothetical protein